MEITPALIICNFLHLALTYSLKTCSDGNYLTNQIFTSCSDILVLHAPTGITFHPPEASKLLTEQLKLLLSWQFIQHLEVQPRAFSFQVSNISAENSNSHMAHLWFSGTISSWHHSQSCMTSWEFSFKRCP